MKHPRPILAITLPLLIFLAFVSGLRAQTPTQRVIALSLCESFFSEDYLKLRSLLTENLLLQMDIPKWKELHGQISKMLGKHRRHELRTATVDGALANIVVRAWFERDSLDFRAVVDSTNLVSGFWIEPIRKKYAYPQPPYALKSRFSETTLWIGDSIRLPAVLTVPKDQGPGPFAAVVLVHGSGAHDRDETLNGNKPFRDIAWGLATRGVVVLRYDKRTKVAPRRMNPLTMTVQEEVIDDAMMAVRLLASRPETDTTRLSLLGHSLGAMLAPEIAWREPRVRGIAMLAAPAKRLDEILADQLRFLMMQHDTLSTEERAGYETRIAQVDSLVRGQLDSSVVVMGSIPARYIYDLRGRNQVEFAKKLHIPIFLASAGKDYQVPPAEFEAWRVALKGKPQVTAKTYPDCFHLFIPTKAKPSPSNYEEEGFVLEDLINDLSAWLKRK